MMRLRRNGSAELNAEAAARFAQRPFAAVAPVEVPSEALRFCVGFCPHKDDSPFDLHNGMVALRVMPGNLSSLARQMLGRS
jgi:hypothetical protein